MQTKEIELNYFINEMNSKYSSFYNEPMRPFKVIEQDGKFNFQDFEDEKMQHTYVMPEFVSLDIFVTFVRVVHGLISMIEVNTNMIRTKGNTNE